MKKEIIIDDKKYYSVEVKLPKTNLLIVGNDIGFVMCGALNVDIYDTPKLLPRKVVCVRVVGVKTIDELIEARVEEATSAARELGIFNGMCVKDALNLLS